MQQPKPFQYYSSVSKQAVSSVSPVKRASRQSDVLRSMQAQASPEIIKTKRLNKAVKGSFITSLSSKVLEGVKASPGPIKTAFHSPMKLSKEYHKRAASAIWNTEGRAE